MSRIVDNGEKTSSSLDEETMATFQMLQYLSELKASNPEAFIKALESAGVPQLASIFDSMEENSIEPKVSGSASVLGANKKKGGNSISTANPEQLAEAMRMLKSASDEGNNTLEALKLNKTAPAKGISIQPIAGFSYKTLRIKDQMKIFINITSHETIEKPGMKKKLDSEGNEVEGMNIPMSVGSGRQEVDKKGVSCAVYDIVVHPDVVADVDADQTGKFREFLCQLGIQCLEQKYKEELDKRYKLPKLKYMGSSIPTQMIQDRKNMPRIEEVSIPTNKVKAPAKKEAKKTVEEPLKELNISARWCGWKHCTDMDSESVLTVSNALAKDCINQDFYSNAYESPPNSNLTWSPYAYSLFEYLDPIVRPPMGISFLVLFADFIAYNLENLLSSIEINISPFRLSVKLPQYRAITIYFGAAVSPHSSNFQIIQPEGSISMRRLVVCLHLDTAPWDAEPDAGSKTWLMAQAIRNDDQNYYSPASMKTVTDKGELSSSINDEEFPEDKFHIKLPENVDQYTGIAMDNSDESELPEDRFHQKDVSSQYIINQRESAKKEKWEKYEKEKAERVNDPNVEYIDMSDFRAGGKYGGDKKASDDTGSVGGGDIVSANEHSKVAEVLLSSTPQNLNLQSTLWAELLD